jgi:hypothetical protein
MTITVHIHDSWAAVPVALSRLLVALRALERPRQPGDDAEDLTLLLDGIDAPEPAAMPSPAAARPPAALPSAGRQQPAKPFEGVPTTGKAFYRFCTSTKQLPKANAIGKREGWPRLVSDWSEDMVSLAYGELTAFEPAANGQPR